MISEYKIIELSTGDNIPASLFDLYCEAFPPTERRDWTNAEDIGEFMRSHSHMRIKMIETPDGFAGFMIYWLLAPGIQYVEHLATLTNMRGKGLGAHLFESLKEVPDSGILLEVEPPVDELAHRRVGFYKRLGLTIHDKVTYIQPPYHPGLPSLELSIMTTPNITDADLERDLIRLLHERIYNHKK